MDHSLVPNHENPDDARVISENVPDDNRQAAASRNGRGNAYNSQQKELHADVWRRCELP